jgi:hypothetical protein
MKTDQKPHWQQEGMSNPAALTKQGCITISDPGHF